MVKVTSFFIIQLFGKSLRFTDTQKPIGHYSRLEPTIENAPLSRNPNCSNIVGPLRATCQLRALCPTRLMWVMAAGIRTSTTTDWLPNAGIAPSSDRTAENSRILSVSRAIQK
jgi:hypothetical protein